MLNLKKCKEILEKHNEKYTDKEIQTILDTMYCFAEFDIKKLKKRTNAENSHINVPGQQR